jgi:putative IMPACT (imprinted ancient) family translation regulator
VDRLSKSSPFLTLIHPFNSKGVAKKFMEGIIKLHWLAKSIISDRNPIFINRFL